MMTTLTILDGKRVAQGFDYPSAMIYPDGSTARNGSAHRGGVHLIVEFDVTDAGAVVIHKLRDLDTLQPPQFSGGASVVKIAEAIGEHCRQCAQA